MPDDHRGDIVLRAAWVGTGAYTLTAVATLVSVTTFALPLVIVCGLLFVLGMVAFAAAYLIAVSRSREVLIGMGGLYFLAGSAPRRVRVSLLGAFAVQIVVATVTASIGIALVADDANNPLAFGFLVPLYGLGLAGLWGARFGTFTPRPDAAGARDDPTRSSD